jgi:hypothetical protein
MGHFNLFLAFTLLSDLDIFLCLTKNLTGRKGYKAGVGNLRLASHMRLFGCEAAAL